ncbi:MAG: glycosyltransferase [Bacilli bacterium]|nr:glycosyltransferase [Bacilli bacterium]
MKIAFLLGSPDIGGGTYVIFQHALKCLECNYEVIIVTDEIVTKERIAWHKDAYKLTFKKYSDVENEKFDVIIATWWRTIYELPKIKAKAYIYFVQSIESKFYADTEAGLKWLADATYQLPLSIITEATWIKEYLEENYFLNVKLIKNGIRKDIYKVDGDKYEKDEQKLRVLIEGPIDVFFKNVPKTVELLKKSKADEIWLLTSSNIKKYPGVDRVFSRVPINECAKIYRSCDVLVKLSYVEGMFGPPLEMFHCGGTAITYDVTGYDEYLIDGYNSIIIKKDDDDKVVLAINQLSDNKKFLSELKENAIKTANSWIDWDKSSLEFKHAIDELAKIKLNSKIINTKTNFLFNTYIMYEQKSKSFRRYLGDFLRMKLPFIYKLYRKIIK